MKSIVVYSIVMISFIITSCTSQKLVFNTDDVYTNPKEVKLALAIEQQKNEALTKKYNDSIVLVNQEQQRKDDANPYYKDREFKYDDYYDYEYATRVKRFNNNINGLSYYDNYYTNSYWYNHNPYSYGTSVYNGYSWWGQNYNTYSYNPSAYFYNNQGWGYNDPFANTSYNSYMMGYTQGYGSGFNNGMMGNYYGYGNPYSLGYGNIYNNGLNNNNTTNWGYFNSYDSNSGYTYAARVPRTGGNSERTSSPAVTTNNDTYYGNFVKTITNTQDNTVKFTPITTTVPHTTNNATNQSTRYGYKPTIIDQSAVQKNNNSTQQSVPHPIKTVQQIQNKEATPLFETPTLQHNHQASPSNGGNTTTPINGSGSRPR